MLTRLEVLGMQAQGSLEREPAPAAPFGMVWLHAIADPSLGLL